MRECNSKNSPLLLRQRTVVYPETDMQQQQELSVRRSWKITRNARARVREREREPWINSVNSTAAAAAQVTWFLGHILRDADDAFRVL